MAVLGLRFCARASSVCGEQGPLFIAVRGPLTVAASLAAEHRLQTRRLSSCGSRAQLLRSMWDPPRTGFEPVSSALAGRFPTTAPPGKPIPHLFYPFICRWTFGLFPCLDYCKYCCYEHRGACIFSNYIFVRIHAQEWDCWIIW